MKLKTVRIRLKTGELIVRKNIQEFIIGRKYIIWIDDAEQTEIFEVDNILSLELYSKGEFVPVSFNKRGKHESK